MTQFLQSLLDASNSFDVAVLDQWGVLHDGTNPYPQAIQALHDLRAAGKDVLVLSNSGKRADLNRKRIADLGLPVDAISQVITSGEAAWLDLTEGRITAAGRGAFTVLPLCAAPSDAVNWLGDAATITLAQSLDNSVDALLLMGLPDNSPDDVHDDLFRAALERDLPCICSNPDKLGIRANGMVRSPGQLAADYETAGGNVIWYGKPYSSVFEAVRRLHPDLLADRFLMVGDSLEHDIAGGNTAGFQTAFVRGGIHANAFAASQDLAATLAQLTADQTNTQPTYSLAMLA